MGERAGEESNIPPTGQRGKGGTERRRPPTVRGESNEIKQQGEGGETKGTKTAGQGAGGGVILYRNLKTSPVAQPVSNSCLTGVGE